MHEVLIECFNPFVQFSGPPCIYIAAKWEMPNGDKCNDILVYEPSTEALLWFEPPDNMQDSLIAPLFHHKFMMLIKEPPQFELHNVQYGTHGTRVNYDHARFGHAVVVSFGPELPTCAMCGELATHVCLGCKKAQLHTYYCSRVCQKVHFKLTHNLICPRAHVST